MNWIDVDKDLPNNSRNVLVSDGYDSYCVAWYSGYNKEWTATNDMLEACGYEGCMPITLSGRVRFWTDILGQTLDKQNQSI